MKILFVSLHYAPELTGNAPYVSSLARALAERGHMVEVVTTHPHYPQWELAEGYGGWRVRETAAERLTITRLRHYIPRRPTTLRRAIAEASFGVRALLARWPKADVVVLVSPGLIASRIVRLRARRAPASVVWVQDIYSLGLSETGQGGGLMTRLMARIESDTLRGPAHVMAIHRRFRDYLTAALGVDRARVEVIRNWTHLNAAPDFDRAATRARLGWGEDETIVLHAGNQGVKQGLENVVNAARVADRDQSPVRFVLLGHGNQHRRLRELATGVERIQFIEPLPDDEYQAVMNASDVLLVNERTGVAEMSVPSKLTSYFSTGLPVLAATDAGSVTSEEVAAAEAGLRVDADDPDALVAGAERLRALPDGGRGMGAAGRRYVASVLSKDAAVDHVETWFTELLEPARPAPRVEAVH